MNRVIKARAWDERIQDYHYLEDTRIDVFFSLYSEMPFEQSTGVFDRDKTEIYEGDILQRFNREGYKAGNRPLIVVQWMEKPNGVGFNIGCHGYRKIVGSVRKNPELLEK